MALSAFMLPILYAQSDNGRITGTVRDASSAVIAKASVTIRNEKTGELRKTEANDQGIYLVSPLGPSTYTITAEATGMSQAGFQGISLQVGQVRTLNITCNPPR